MIDEHKVGQRLRERRKAAGRTQGEVAADLGVSRPTVAQMELGNRAIKVSEVERVAKAYGSDVRQFMAPSPSQRGGDDVLDDLVRTLPSLEATREKLGRLVATCRALTEIEGMLAVHAYGARPPSQALSAPESPWEAVHQGYATAEEERRRLNLGDGPIRDVAETLAVVGVRPSKLGLPNGISSLMISSEETGFLVVVNKNPPVEERRFQYLHAYAHVLFDRDVGSCVCQGRDAETLPELRASAFASRFLVPEQGLKRYLQSLGKDTLARSGGTRRQIYSEREASPLAERRVSVSGRDRRGAALCGTVEVTLTGGYFGASVLLICHALRDLGLISRSDLDDLASRVTEGNTKQTRAALDLPAWGPERNAFRTRLLVVASDALAQGLISRERFEGILEQAELPLSYQQRLIDGVAAATGTRGPRRRS